MSIEFHCMTEKILPLFFIEKLFMIYIKVLNIKIKSFLHSVGYETKKIHIVARDSQMEKVP